MSLLEEMQLRANRVSRPVGPVYDLARLFVWLRERKGVSPIIDEIGNFVAHPSDRDRGLTTDLMRSFFSHARFREEVASGIIDLADVPHDFVAAMRSNLAHLSDNVLAEARMSRATLASQLELALAEFEKKPNC